MNPHVPPDTRITPGFVLLVLYLGILFFEPQQFLPALEKIRITYLFGIFVLCWAILSSPSEVKQGLFESKILWLVIIFVVICSLGLLQSETPVMENRVLKDFQKAIAVFLMVAFSIRTKPDLFRLCWVLVIFTTINATVTLYYYHMGILATRMASYFGSLGQSGSNEFALIFVQMLPFPVLLMRHQKSKVSTYFLVFSLITYLYCLTRTRSRTGFLGFVFVIVVLIVLKRLSGRQILLLFCILLILAFKTPISFWERMTTIWQPETLTTDRNITTRVESNANALDMIANRPLLGVGLGNFQRYACRYYYQGEYERTFVVHNGYLLVASESGVPAMLIFLNILYVTIRTLLKIRKEIGVDTEMAIVGDMFLVGILGYCFAILFQPTIFSRLFYIQLGCAVRLAGLEYAIKRKEELN